MAEMIPVGNTGTPPNVGQTLSNLSSIYGIQQQQLGLQQQRQQLQTGQYHQATEQAESEQATAKNQALQAAQSYLKNAVNDPSFSKDDGTPDVDKFQKGLSTVGGIYVQPYIGQLTDNFTGAVTNRKTLLGLGKEQRATAGEYLGAVAADPNATAAKLQSAVSRARSLSADKGYQDMLDSMLTHAPQTSGMPDDQIAGSIRDYARQVAVQVGAPNAALSAPTTTDYTTPEGNIGQRQTNPLSPMGLGPVGPQTPQGVGPAQRLPQAATNAAGQILNRDPITGTLSLPGQGQAPRFSQAAFNPTPGAPSAPGQQPSNLNPSNAAAGAQVDDNTRYKQISDAAQMSQTGENLARNVAHLAKGVDLRTGKFSGDVTDWLTTIRQKDPALTDRQLLSKYAAQLQNTALQAFSSDTDLSRGVTLHGMPDPDKMNPDAIEDASRYVGGLMTMSGARNQVASKYVRSNSGSPVGLRANVDDDFMRHANPDVFTYMQMEPGKDRQSWLKRHGYSDPQANAQLRRQLQVMSQYGVQ